MLCGVAVGCDNWVWFYYVVGSPADRRWMAVWRVGIGRRIAATHLVDRGEAAGDGGLSGGAESSGKAARTAACPTGDKEIGTSSKGRSASYPPASVDAPRRVYGGEASDLGSDGGGGACLCAATEGSGQAHTRGDDMGCLAGGAADRIGTGGGGDAPHCALRALDGEGASHASSRAALRTCLGEDFAIPPLRGMIGRALQSGGFCPHDGRRQPGCAAWVRPHGGDGVGGS